jgi:predicted CXXCH cytochrome family protein
MQRIAPTRCRWNRTRRRRTACGATVISRIVSTCIPRCRWAARPAIRSRPKTSHRREVYGTGGPNVRKLSRAFHYGQSVARSLPGGLCVACHSPHASDFPAHTWASAQDICMGCHTRQLKVDESKQTVTAPWGQTLTFAQMKGCLNATETLNHPVEGHPVSGPNTSPKLAPVTCLSCHRPHASNYANLLSVGPWLRCQTATPADCASSATRTCTRTLSKLSAEI